jgi:hypothetical protein
MRFSSIRNTQGNPIASFFKEAFYLRLKMVEKPGSSGAKLSWLEKISPPSMPQWGLGREREFLGFADGIVQRI